MTADFKKKKGAITSVEEGPPDPQYIVYNERYYQLGFRIKFVEIRKYSSIFPFQVVDYGDSYFAQFS